VAKHVGARNVVITDVNEYRLSLARKMGVTRGDVSKEPDRRDGRAGHDRRL
jgi:threonine 3-dehydrogenase